MLGHRHPEVQAVPRPSIQEKQVGVAFSPKVGKARFVSFVEEEKHLHLG
jgi:hypothetical protein